MGLGVVGAAIGAPIADGPLPAMCIAATAGPIALGAVVALDAVAHAKPPPSPSTSTSTSTSTDDGSPQPAAAAPPMAY